MENKKNIDKTELYSEILIVANVTMECFVNSLEKELNKKLKKIEDSDLNILKKSLEASLVLGDAFQRMRDFVATYTFKNEAEEIRFFKEIKPRLFFVCSIIARSTTSR